MYPRTVSSFPEQSQKFGIFGPRFGIKSLKCIRLSCNLELKLIGATNKSGQNLGKIGHVQLGISWINWDFIGHFGIKTYSSLRLSCCLEFWRKEATDKLG